MKGRPEGTETRYYDLEGKPITSSEWNALRMSAIEDGTFKLADTDIPKRKLTVSTVWLGLDHSMDFSKHHSPLIYETMVFNKEPGEEYPSEFEDRFCERYSTPAEALEGHERIVAAIKEGSLALHS